MNNKNPYSPCPDDVYELRESFEAIMKAYKEMEARFDIENFKASLLMADLVYWYNACAGDVDKLARFKLHALESFLRKGGVNIKIEVETEDE